MRKEEWQGHGRAAAGLLSTDSPSALGHSIQSQRGVCSVLSEITSNTVRSLYLGTGPHLPLGGGAGIHWTGARVTSEDGALQLFILTTCNVI